IVRRKGITETGLVAIILVLASGIVLGALVYQFTVKGKQVGSIELCRQNVLTASKVVALGKADIWPITNCFTEDLGKLPEKEEEAITLIAEGIRKCWYMWGEGKLTPWSSTWLSRNIMCHVCTMFEPSAEVSIEKLHGWMRTHNIPGKELTYYDFLKEGYIPFIYPALEEEAKAKKVDLTKGMKWAVFYAYGTRADWLRFPLIGGLVLEEPKQGVAFLPTNELGGICTYTTIKLK
ncbi:MAG: hypothetical protein QXN46_00575, partial [Candidatus Woesearchaeota archaeon]